MSAKTVVALCFSTVNKKFLCRVHTVGVLLMILSSVSFSDSALRHFKFSSLVYLLSTDCSITTPFQRHLHLYIAIYGKKHLSRSEYFPILAMLLMEKNADLHTLLTCLDNIRCESTGTARSWAADR